MSWTSRFTRSVLKYSPRALKDVVRRLTPQAFYQLVARTAAGEHKQHGQLYLSDPRVRGLEDRLWHGFANLAQVDLEALLTTSTSRQQRAEAAMALARYHAARNEWGQVIDRLAIVQSDSQGLWKHKRTRILEMYALSGLGRHEAAQKVAELARREHPLHASMGIACASVVLAGAKIKSDQRQQAEQTWLDAMNGVLERAGLVGLALDAPERGLRLDNLVARETPTEPAEMSAKVSVLMAVYNGAENLEWVVRSLLAQTWRNLELVMVDDASTDNSWNVIQALAAKDSRIVPIRQAVNGGAYVARNAALARASGDFVTVNDADDWAHPQKIEAQVTRLLGHDAPLANTSSLIRVTGAMLAQPRFDSAHAAIVHKNFSALMLPRKTALDMGGWDRVRISGDSEFIGRLAMLHGSDALKQPFPEAPLSLALLDKNNLTSSSSRSLWTFHFGVRREYARQAKEWHRAVCPQRLKRESQYKPFPIPGLCYHKGAQEQRFDIVVLSDFASPVDLEPHVHDGKRVAIVPWPDYGARHDAAMDEAVSRLCRERGVTTLAHGENASCSRLVIVHPHLLLQPPDRLPTIRADEVIAENADLIADKERIAKVVQNLVGLAPRWESENASDVPLT